jgi:xylan 1,4-beta-xylosidase
MPTRPLTTLLRRTAIALAALALALATPVEARAATTFANPVLPGDHPDPTIVRVGSTFYASATSASWAPIFPVFRSTDLVHWRQIGSVLPRAPAWSAGNYWAPELVRWSGRMLLFYSASRADGRRPCIAVATAPRPGGPWRDRGPALCRPGGVIDADPFTDVDGSRWLVFKQMGPGRGIYAMRFSQRRLRAVGHAHALVAPTRGWEGGVTEGPNLVHQGNGYLLFYAGGHCCRPPCSYGEGAARAPSLLGPYTKAPGNPLLVGNEAWKCPGHGTTIDLGPAGLFLLHHGYRTDDVLDRRRTSLLTRIDFAPDGWPVFGGGAGPPVSAPAPLGAAAAPAPAAFSDRFTRGALAPGWEWPFYAAPSVRTGHGLLSLGCRGAGRNPEFVARQVPVDRFTAAATVRLPRKGGPAVGLAAHGPGRVLRGIEVRGRRVRVFRRTERKLSLGPVVRAPVGDRVRLLIDVTPDGAVAFSVGTAGRFTRVTGPAEAGAPPTRVALTCRGTGTARIASIRVLAQG